ncbi:hypothetical protein BTO01_25900 [Vibrio jasicida]|nr:hypothetical protein BTO01_25900 [Vibrio jasicida]
MVGVLWWETKGSSLGNLKQRKRKNVNIIEAECCADHIHMPLEIPPKMSVSSFMGYLKGESSLMLYE